MRDEHYTCATKGCGARMIPHVGSKRRHHFAHKGGDPNCTPSRAFHDGLVQEIAHHLNAGKMTFTLNCEMCSHNDLLQVSSARAEVNLSEPNRRPDILLIGLDGEVEAAIEVVVTNYPDEEKIRDLSIWGKPVYFMVVAAGRAGDEIAESLCNPRFSGVLIGDTLCTADTRVRRRFVGESVRDCSLLCCKKTQPMMRLEAARTVFFTQCQSWGWHIDKQHDSTTVASRGACRMVFTFQDHEERPLWVDLTHVNPYSYSGKVDTKVIQLDRRRIIADTRALQEGLAEFFAHFR